LDECLRCEKFAALRFTVTMEEHNESRPVGLAL